ncbi:MAG: membrane dipeptidase [Firmicutes bacterium]|nr:membrane dipeptidase [Bacillota bacterium]MDY5531841.1 membrane dipeptidase [Pumilibacteraceae bacterium]
MRIFDLHNDLITSEVDFGNAENIIQSDRDNDREILYAVWATKLNLSDFTEKSRFLSDRGRYSVEDASVVGEDFDALLTENLACCSLTWNYNNALAGGAYENGDLTEHGEKFVDYLNDKDVIIDLSHLNERSFYSVIIRAKRVVATHSGIFSNKKCLRNLKYSQVREIIGNGGLVGLTPVPKFVRNGDEHGYFDTIYRFIDKFGCDNVAIGTDFYGSDPIKGLENYDELVQKVEFFISKRYGASCAKKLLYENAERFFE